MNDISATIDKLEIIQNEWSKLSVLPEDLLNSSRGLTKTDALATIGAIKSQLESASELGQSITAIYQQQIELLTSNLESLVKQVAANPGGMIPPVVGTLYSLASAVDIAVVDTSSDKGILGKFIEKQRSRLADSLAKTEIINDRLAEVEKLAEVNAVNSVEIDKASKQSAESLLLIQERDRNASEAAARISATESKIVTLSQDLETNLKRVTDANNAISEQEKKTFEMSRTLESKLQEAQNLLDDANRVGLAGAFKTRKEELDTPAIFWVVAFFGSMLLLALYAYFHLVDIGTDPWVLLLRLPISAPLIWLGWFSVKQYGYTRRMQEDYAFKMASAMSFQGYKNELSPEVELLKQLRQAAVDNFSQNPMRVYDAKQNHGSPAHEMLDKLSDSAVLQKASELIALLKQAPRS